jgi:hypothetical protein
MHQFAHFDIVKNYIELLRCRTPPHAGVHTTTMATQATRTRTRAHMALVRSLWCVDNPAGSRRSSPIAHFTSTPF